MLGRLLCSCACKPGWLIKQAIIPTQKIFFFIMVIFQFLIQSTNLKTNFLTIYLHQYWAVITDMFSGNTSMYRPDQFSGHTKQILHFACKPRQAYLVKLKLFFERLYPDSLSA